MHSAYIYHYIHIYKKYTSTCTNTYIYTHRPRHTYTCTLYVSVYIYMLDPLGAPEFQAAPGSAEPHGGGAVPQALRGRSKAAEAGTPHLM